MIICTTTIDKPSKEIIKFAEIAEEHTHTLIIAGDLKTPHDDYNLLAKDFERVIYLDPEFQEENWKDLSDIIGWKSIQRRNFAFLAASSCHDDLIATVDSDNMPLDNWGKEILIGQDVECNRYESENGFFDPFQGADLKHRNLHHRGYPIQFLRGRHSVGKRGIVKADIQANFWNGDPDIDAITRIQHAPECQFHDSYFPFFSNQISPFNSQNTFLDKRVLPYYMMFPHQSVGRLDDIVGSVLAQLNGFKVVYHKATVEQIRVGHDLTKDMEKEYWGYSNMHKIFSAKSPDEMLKLLPEQAQDAYRIYRSYFD